MKQEKYSDDAFWKKAGKYARIAGKNVMEKALWLYYVAQDSETPMRAKAVIYSALAYFISPLDAIADVTPVVGFTDDLGALAAAVLLLSVHITPKVKKQAAEKMSEWFDDSD